MLNPDRYSTTNVKQPKNGVIVHDSEGREGGTASEGLCTALEAPGDRLIAGSNPPRKYGSGYHAVANEAGGYTICATGGMGPYHAPPLNKNFWSVCIPGKAGQTREQWLDEPSRNYIKGVAKYIVDRWHDDGKRWPLEFKSSEDLKTILGANSIQAEISTKPVGYSSHSQVSNAWGRTDHWDPGPAFPWDILAADISSLIEQPAPPPEEEDDMAYVIFDIIDKPDMFGGFGLPIIKDGKPTGGYFVPEVVHMSPAMYNNAVSAPQGTSFGVVVKPLDKSDLKTIALDGPLPAGYVETDFAQKI